MHDRWSFSSVEQLTHTAIWYITTSILSSHSGTTIHTVCGTACVCTFTVLRECMQVAHHVQQCCSAACDKTVVFYKPVTAHAAQARAHLAAACNADQQFQAATVNLHACTSTLEWPQAAETISAAFANAPLHRL